MHEVRQPEPVASAKATCGESGDPVAVPISPESYEWTGESVTCFIVASINR